MVAWSALSAVDGHVTRGVFPLVVGAGGLEISLEEEPVTLPNPLDVLRAVGGVPRRAGAGRRLHLPGRPSQARSSPRTATADLERQYDRRLRRVRAGRLRRGRGWRCCSACWSRPRTRPTSASCRRSGRRWSDSPAPRSARSGACGSAASSLLALIFWLLPGAPPGSGRAGCRRRAAARDQPDQPRGGGPERRLAGDRRGLGPSGRGGGLGRRPVRVRAAPGARPAAPGSRPPDAVRREPGTALLVVGDRRRGRCWPLTGLFHVLAPGQDARRARHDARRVAGGEAAAGRADAGARRDEPAGRPASAAGASSRTASGASACRRRPSCAASTWRSWPRPRWRSACCWRPAS